MDHLFSDGIADSSFVNGLIRVDFFRFSQGSEGEGDKKHPLRELAHRLVMSPDAFLQMQQSLAQMTKRLVARGILRQKPAEEEKGKEKAEKGKK